MEIDSRSMMAQVQMVAMQSSAPLAAECVEMVRVVDDSLDSLDRDRMVEIVGGIEIEVEMVEAVVGRTSELAHELR